MAWWELGGLPWVVRKVHAVVPSWADAHQHHDCCMFVLLITQAELMYRRNKEEVEGLQAKRKQVR
jgi:hypothetical protein